MQAIPATLDRFWSLMWSEVAGVAIAVWAFVAAFVLAMLGLLWDGAWHASWGRDTFFIPPHDMLYTMVTITLGLSHAILVSGSLRERDPGFIHIRRLQAPLGIWGVFVGCLMLIGAAPFDEWWHRRFGRDDGTGLWSPPHFAGMVGGLVVCLGILILLRQSEPRPAGRGGRPPGLRGLTTNDRITLLMLGFVTFIVGGLTLNFFGIRHWYRTEGTVYPILTMLTGPALAVLAQRVTGRAGAATVAVALPFAFIGAVGAVLRAFNYPIVVSLPVMGLPSAIVLDAFYARFGSDRRWLVVAGLLAALVFYPSEFLWSWLLNGKVMWTLAPTLMALPLGLATGAASALLGAWLGRRFPGLEPAGSRG